MRKLGFDIHGVIDTFDVFREMIEMYQKDENVEVHVITGLEVKYMEKQIGHLIDLDKCVLFSVTDYLVEIGAKVEWIDGMPWADADDWNKAKAAYCNDIKLDVLFDDSPIYAPFFDDIDTIYCQIHNPHRKKFKTRTNL